MPGVNSSAEGELCNMVHVQTNASVGYQRKFYNATGMPIHLPSLWLDPISCRLVSPLSGVDWSLASPIANSNFSVPLSNSLLASPYHFQLSQVQNPLSGFALKQTKESSAQRTTYIMLHTFPKIQAWSIIIRSILVSYPGLFR